MHAPILTFIVPGVKTGRHLEPDLHDRSPELILKEAHAVLDRQVS